jgi:hypothetical protein
MIRNRTQLANAIRGHAAEFGLTAAKGMAHLVPLLERIQADESLPALARELFAAQAKDCEQLETQIDEVDAQLMARHRADKCSRHLAKIPGIGPVGATLLTMQTPAPELFRSGRQFAAWIGLTPRDHSTAGKVGRTAKHLARKGPFSNRASSVNCLLLAAAVVAMPGSRFSPRSACAAATSGPKHRRCNVHNGLTCNARGPTASLAASLHPRPGGQPSHPC